MRINKLGKLAFKDGYERMAYLTLEYATGSQTQTQLAYKCGLSVQRVNQIVKAGYGRAGCRPGDHYGKVSYGLALADSIRAGRRPEPGTPEFFYKFERFEDWRES